MADDRTPLPRGIHREGWRLTAVRFGVGMGALDFSAQCDHGGWLLHASADAAGAEHLGVVLWGCFGRSDDTFHLDDIIGWCDLSGLPLNWTFERERMVSPFDERYTGSRSVIERVPPETIVDRLRDFVSSSEDEWESSFELSPSDAEDLLDRIGPDR